MTKRTLIEGFRVYAYTEPGKCQWCEKAKELLDREGAFYAIFDIADPINKAFIKSQGHKTVPQIWHGDRHIGGFEKLEAYIKESRK